MSIDQVVAGSAHGIADRLVETFASAHGRAPAGCFAAPGRVNLIGEHVDYNDGRCLPMALAHATYAALAARDDGRVSITSLQQREPWRGRIDTLGPGEVDGWAAYVAGVVWALQRDGIDLPGLDIVIDSRVPMAAGLSSSAALECSVAIGLCAAAGIPVDDTVRRRLVKACMRAETEVAGAPTGGMDQTVSLLATPGHALLIDCRDWSTQQVRWIPESAGLELLVVDTRARRSLADGGYASRRRDCEAAARSLRVRSLREVDDAQAALSRLEDERLRRRARHVFAEMARVDQAVDQLRDSDFAGLGHTLSASHDSLRDDFDVSSPELDLVVSTALDHGALGSRMTGGGFGGSAIALVRQGAVGEVGAAIAAAFSDRGWPAPGLLLAVPGDRARQVS